MRISKGDGSQSFDLQRDALIESGVHEDHIYEDNISGKNGERPGLESCLKALQPGNTLVVWKLDRLGRDLKHLLVIIDKLILKKVDFKVLTGQGAQIDTTTTHGRLMLGVFGALAEYERDLLIERTIAGLKAARARGRMGGRPRKMDEEKIRIAIAAMSDPKASPIAICKNLGIGRTTLYTYLKKNRN